MRRKKILVVDDDSELLDLLRFNLKRAGFAVGTATNGVEALRKTCSISPDLILLDLMLPELDGFAVCQLLRRDSATAFIPIIMLTALAGELGRMVGMDSGADDYMTKPFNTSALVQRVQQLIRHPPRARSGFAEFPLAPQQLPWSHHP